MLQIGEKLTQYDTRMQGYSPVITIPPYAVIVTSYSYTS